MVQEEVGKMEINNFNKIIFIIVIILLGSLLIQFFLGFISDSGFKQTIWMKILIVVNCIIVIYYLMKGRNK